MFFPGGDADSFAEHVYKSMDKNLDGAVDFREFAQMLSVSKKGTQDEKIKMAFHMYDLDKNGLVRVFPIFCNAFSNRYLRQSIQFKNGPNKTCGKRPLKNLE